jgi:ABC-type branched-subunit amino acid transport system permease subunit
VALALVVAALIATRMLERSRLGAQLVAVRENEARRARSASMRWP